MSFSVISDRLVTKYRSSALICSLDVYRSSPYTSETLNLGVVLALTLVSASSQYW